MDTRIWNPHFVIPAMVLLHRLVWMWTMRLSENSANPFLFNKDLPIDLPSSQSLFRLSESASYGEEMMTGIGQGDTVVSPFEMALVSATVANGGVMMNPYYIDHYRDV